MPWSSVGCCSSRSPSDTSGEPVRWLGRLLLEHPGVSLRHAELAAAYLAAWPYPARHDAASEALVELGRAVGLRRLGTRLARADDG
jgi:hypothetical protein